MTVARAEDPSNPSRWEQLLDIRERFGPLYGSENLCVLLYSLVRRERPQRLVELGTGLGVCSLWIAHGLEENGAGHLQSFDNGNHFMNSPVVFTTMAKGILSLQDHAFTKPSVYFDLLDGMARDLGVKDRVNFNNATIEFGGNISSLFEEHEIESIDWLFADVAHGPKAIVSILRACLPRMTDNASIFIDSALSHPPSRQLLEDLVCQFNAGHVPDVFAGEDGQEQHVWAQAIANRRFSLMPLREAKDRAQNGAVWIKIVREVLPEGVTLEASGDTFPR